jgi:hypothetical protein
MLVKDKASSVQLLKSIIFNPFLPVHSYFTHIALTLLTKTCSRAQSHKPPSVYCSMRKHEWHANDNLQIVQRIWCLTVICDMQDALVAIKDGGVPPPGALPSFQEIKDTLGFNRYYKEEKQYQVVSHDVFFSLLIQICLANCVSNHMLPFQYT